ncbi:hypothetical protein SAMD00019534_046010, partial [Acytostelium subglobosum LB1]|uniref:hypothetical protein n=1 Tax=Acytostelium subglobosum LB1 TaxID=1410327 RepID=UPI000644F568
MAIWTINHNYPAQTLGQESITIELQDEVVLVNNKEVQYQQQLQKRVESTPTRSNDQMELVAKFQYGRHRYTIARGPMFPFFGTNTQLLCDGINVLNWNSQDAVVEEEESSDMSKRRSKITFGTCIFFIMLLISLVTIRTYTLLALGAYVLLVSAYFQRKHYNITLDHFPFRQHLQQPLLIHSFRGDQQQQHTSTTSSSTISQQQHQQHQEEITVVTINQSYVLSDSHYEIGSRLESTTNQGHGNRTTANDDSCRGIRYSHHGVGGIQ